MGGRLKIEHNRKVIVFWLSKLIPDGILRCSSWAIVQTKGLPETAYSTPSPNLEHTAMPLLGDCRNVVVGQTFGLGFSLVEAEPVVLPPQQR
jgi:hypothetical protein